MRLNPGMSALLSIAMTTVGVVAAPPAFAQSACETGGAPPGAASKDVSDAYGQPATLWITNEIVGITTGEGSGQTVIHSASPLPRSALLVDAQQDGTHQIIVSTGREALLYTVSGCTLTPVADGQGTPLRLDLGHRMNTGDGIGCSDLGDGRHLVGLLRIRDQPGEPLLGVRRTEIDLNGATATTGRTDTVTATSEQDPAWTSAGTISCGDLTIARDGVQASY